MRRSGCRDADAEATNAEAEMLRCGCGDVDAEIRMGRCGCGDAEMWICGYADAKMLQMYLRISASAYLHPHPHPHLYTRISAYPHIRISASGDDMRRCEDAGAGMRMRTVGCGV